MSDLAKYTFIPWMRQGLASQIELTDHLGDATDYEPSGAAPTIDLKLELKGEKKVGKDSSDAETIPLEKQIRLYHPGDITGIEGRAIIKTEPKNGVKQFEANFLPFIEFYEEDFPWRYTPLKANQNRLRPWLALVVLKAEEFELERIDPRLPLRSIKLSGELAEIPFPSAYQLWAWAHVHVNKKMGDDAKSDLKSIIDHSPNLACSRLICPRKLEPETEYFAFLIPSFEKGRLAGLGATSIVIEDTDIQLAAWGHEQSHFSGFAIYQKRFPFYYEWSFKTGEEGNDFEALAKKIVPRKLHPNVGKRLVDIQSPGYNLFYEGGDYPNQGAVLMEGALRHPDSDLPNLLDEETPENEEFTTQLADLINLEDDLKTDELSADHSFSVNPYFEEDDESIYDDPIITPPLYGQWHVNQHRVSTENKNQWVDQLNLDPRNRLAAGLGVEVVRRNQEDYMDRAWRQYGELFKINDLLRQAQFTMEVNESLFKKHIKPLHPATFVAVTANAHRTVKPSGDTKTLKSTLKTVQVPDGLFSTGYKKITRRGGSLVKRAKEFKPLSNDVANSGMDPTKFLADNDNISNAGEYTEFPDTYLRALLYNGMNGLDDPNYLSWKQLFLRENGVPSDEARTDLALSSFKDALQKIVKQNLVIKENYFGVNNWRLDPKKTAANLSDYQERMNDKLAPNSAFYRKMKARLKNVAFDDFIPDDKSWASPITNAPSFNDATYEEILKMSVDDFVPNLDLVPPNTSGLLEVNRKFIESFMVGLNYEMARELLWREFPTDQRGTYFSMFWDAVDNNARNETQRKDIQAIHEWATDTKLGFHPQAGAEAEQLVMVIRGDLLQRYPNTIIYLEKAKVSKNVEDGIEERILSGPSNRIHPIFEAQIAPDLYFLGFNIAKEKVLKGEGYFFIIQERPGEIHFGLDSDIQANVSFDSWDDFNWAHLPIGENPHINIEDKLLGVPPTNNEFYWGRGATEDETAPSEGKGSSADMAGILYQNPVQIAIHASAMLLPLKEGEEG